MKWILLWVVLGIINCIIISRVSYKRYTNDPPNIKELYGAAYLLSITISPIMFIAIIICAIRKLVKRKDDK